MSAFTRFISFGLRDADRRLAAMLAPPPVEPTERYLRESAVISAIDRVTVRLHAGWAASRPERILSDLAGPLAGRRRAERYQSIAAVVLTATAVHVALTLIQGPRPGWFWMVVPSIAAVFALLLAVASRLVR